MIACEDLTAPMNKKHKYGKNTNRRLNQWTKGIIAQAIDDISHRRGSTVVVVNPAYTSQMDSRYGILLGYRNGEKFYCFDRVVMQADYNAARNILSRLTDTEITRYMPYRVVKRILMERTQIFKERNPGSGDCPTEALVGRIMLQQSANY